MISTRSLRYSLALLGTIMLLGASCSSAKDGGVFRSLDSGETWEQKVLISQQGNKVTTISDLDVTATTFQPKDANIIYLGTKDHGLYISLTGGEQWTQSSISTGTINSISVDAIDPNNVYIADGSTIMKSVDGGITWTTVYTDPKSGTITTVLADSFTDSRVYATTSSGLVLKSEDFGVNWDIRFQSSDGIQKILMANYDTRVLYILTSKGVIYKSTNGGESADTNVAEAVSSGWSKLLPDDFDSSFRNTTKAFDISLDANDSHILYMITQRGLMRGANDGTSWTDVLTLLGVNNDSNQGIRNVMSTPGNPQQLFFTVNNDIHKSIDGGNTWKIIQHFPSTRKISYTLIDFQTPNVIYVGVQVVKQSGGLIKAKAN